MNAASSYRQRAERENQTNRQQSVEGRDIADGYPGPPDDTTRRDGRVRDLLRFLETYFPQAFPLAWSPDHLRVIAKLEKIILDGGLLAVAMPRGSGKTTIIERAALWAVLYCHRRFVIVVGATETAAEQMLGHLKVELETNELLAVDFPEVCYPIKRLENNARRCVGQLFNGHQTRPAWSSKRVVLPTMPGSAASGTVIHAAGLTGALRGLSHTLLGGEITRPDLALLDDPQTRESAMSPNMSARRAEIVNGDVLGAAGPGKSIACVAAMTVIAPGDLADRTLDREAAPQWQGERTQLMHAMPSETKLWEQYADIRADDFRAGGDGSRATAFYTENREAMDKGADPAWPERFNPGELSATQHAMNLWLRNPAAFAAEYQNEPLRDTSAEASVVDPEAIAQKVNGYKRRIVPQGAEWITAHVDVHDKLLYYTIAAWSPRFDGWVVDYGCYPEQPQRYFTMREAKHTLGTVHTDGGKEASIFAGLWALTDRLCSMEWHREDGSVMRISRLLIDSGYA
ncbi:MAG: terminase gpA endonuclease subunit, partial [Phycisphaeraceae bacterium]